MAGQLEFELREPPQRVALTVSQLLRVVRETLEVQLAEYWVAGEVSNARMAPSNHLYFTLKDARGAINAVMFSSASRRLRFRVVDGMQIVVRGRVNIYEVRGTLQLYVEEIEPRGLGALQMAFEQLKQRLSREGSGGRLTISRSSAHRVLRGEVTLAEAVDQAMAQGGAPADRRSSRQPL